MNTTLPDPIWAPPKIKRLGKTEVPEGVLVFDCRYDEEPFSPSEDGTRLLRSDLVEVLLGTRKPDGTPIGRGFCSMISVSGSVYTRDDEAERLLGHLLTHWHSAQKSYDEIGPEEQDCPHGGQGFRKPVYITICNYVGTLHGSDTEVRVKPFRE